MEPREIIAIVFAPLLPVIYFVAFIFLTESYEGIYITIGAGFAGTVSYLSAFLLGLPSIYLLRYIGWLFIPTLAIFGTLAGVVVFYLFWLSIGYLLESSAPYGLFESLYGALFGFSVSLCYGLIAGIRWHTTNP